MKRTNVDPTNRALTSARGFPTPLLRALALGVVLMWGFGQATEIAIPPACDVGTPVGGNPKIRAVATAADLIALSTAPGCWEPDITIRQTGNIEIPSGTVWIPIGSTIQPVGYKAFNGFEGTYDGGNFEVSGLRLVSNTDLSYEIGFFSWLKDGARVQNLTLTNVDFRGGDAVGGLAGSAFFDVSITDVHVTGSVKGRAEVGGLVGSGDSVEFTNVSFAGTVEQVGYDGSESGYNGYLGGLIGRAEGYLSVKGASVTTTTVDFTRPGAVDLYSAYLGGLVGAFLPGEAYPELEGRLIIENSHFQGVVSATDSYAGGLVGKVEATNARFVNAGFGGEVRGNSYLGGVVGSLELQELGLPSNLLPPGYTLAIGVLFQNLVVDAAIGSPSASDAIGGIAGEIYIYGDGSATFENVSFTGELVGNGPVGGIVGDMAALSTMAGITVNASMDVESEGGGLMGRFNGFGGEGASGASVGLAVNGEGDFGVSITGATVDLTVTYGGDYLGGLIGFADDANVSVASSSVAAAISDVDFGYVGGLIGSLDGGSLSVVGTAVTVDIDIEGDDVGGLIGYADFSFGDLTLTDLTVAGSVRGGDRVGGWIGHGSGFEARGWTGGVTVFGADAVGGLIGEGFDVDIVDARVTGSVTVAGGESVGGLVGSLTGGSVVGSHATVQVSGEDAVGGLVGALSDSHVTQSYATGAVSGDSMVGGLIGSAEDSYVWSAYASGSVAGRSDIGGLVGFSQASGLLDVYATGAVTLTLGASGAAGGLLGSNEGEVAYAYATGLVSGSGDEVGGLVGVNDGDVDHETSFWDIGTSGRAASDGGTGLSTEAMRTFATFAEAWNAASDPRIVASAPRFLGVLDEDYEGAMWVMCDDGIANASPKLIWQVERTTCAPPIASLAISPTDGVNLVRNVPFGLVVTLLNADGVPVVAKDAVTLSLSGSGGAEVGGRLRRLGGADVNPTATVAAGDSSVTVSNLIYTGVSAANGARDVTLVASGLGLQASLSVNVRESDLAITTDPRVIAPDGVSTATITVTLRGLNGAPVAGTPLTISTTLGTLLSLDGVEVSNPVVLATNANGVVQLLLRSTDTPGVASIAAACPVDCASTAMVTFGSTVVTPPSNLIAVAGNQKIWLLFDPSDGNVVKYQVRLAGSEEALLMSDDWVDLPADAEQPYLITDVENDKTVYADARAIGADGATVPSNIAFVTPRVIEMPDADIGVTGRGGVTELVAVNGRAVLEVPFTFLNTGQTFMEDIWLKEDTLVQGGKILDLTTERGTLTRYKNRWFWRGVSLPAGESASGVIFVEVEQ